MMVMDQFLENRVAGKLQEIWISWLDKILNRIVTAVFYGRVMVLLLIQGGQRVYS